jgi:hypothetical protein
MEQACHAGCRKSRLQSRALGDDPIVRDRVATLAAEIEAGLATPALRAPPEEPSSIKTIHEAMLLFQQASRAAGKSSGRTADRAIIPSVSEKALPVYFVKDAGLKEQMVQGQTNPLTDTTYIVDAEVQLVDGAPKGYVVTNVHRVIEGDE